MKFFKNNLKVIISFIIGVILASSITVYASSYFAKDITYNEDKTVEQALNELYVKLNRQATQVTTLTTQGATYTMQNDGYILGTAKFASDATMAKLFLDDKVLALSNWQTTDTSTYYVSVYATAGTVVKTRSDGGTYNLTVYEFK